MRVLEIILPVIVMLVFGMACKKGSGQRFCIKMVTNRKA